MTFIDTHAHIYSEDFAEDLEAIIHTSKQVGIDGIFMPNIDSSSIEAMLQLEEQFPGYCIPMMGLHPCSVKENYEQELEIVERWFDKHKFAAVGEIGIDLYWDKTFYEQQKKALVYQVKLAQREDLPIVIHCRNSFDETIQIIESFNDNKLKGIYHCFTGTLDQAERAIKMGFYLGIGGVATYKNGGLDKVLPFISPENIVFETDSPYLAPVPHRGKRNNPSYIPIIAKSVADMMGIEISQLARITTTNTQLLFKSWR